MNQNLFSLKTWKKVCAVVFVCLTSASIGAAQTISGAAQFVAPDGLTAEKLIAAAAAKRGDLLAARGRLETARARITQAGTRPNPTLDAEYGTPRILGGDAESELSVGVTQVFETGGKRSKRIAVAELELRQIQAEVTALERRFFAEIRAAYGRGTAAARQLEVLEKIQRTDAELIRVTEARLNEGDAAPLDLNLVKVESDRLKIQMIDLQGELETAILELKTLAAMDLTENLQIAPQADRPPRLDASLAELTINALANRADLEAANLEIETNAARIALARSGKTPNVAASMRFTRGTEIFDFPAAPNGNLSDTDNELTFGVSIEIPVFNRARGEIAAATAELGQATRRREFLEAAIRRDVAVAFRRYKMAAEKLVLYATQILPRSEDNLRSVSAAYNLGEFSVFEVVAEQRRLSENAGGYNNAVRDYYQALVELETAVGAPLPATNFAPPETSVLPEKSVVPNQIERENFLRSLSEPKKNQ